MDAIDQICLIDIVVEESNVVEVLAFLLSQGVLTSIEGGISA